MANERLLDFPSKLSPVPADIIYCGDSADAFNEVQITIAALIAAYPALSSIAGLTTVANNLIYTTAANTYSVIAPVVSAVLISSAGGQPSMSQTLPATVQGNITTLGAQAAALNMNSHLINNVTNPVSAQDAATKAYVDNLVAGLNPIPGVAAASTVALTVTYANGSSGVGATLTNAGAQAAFAIDGYTASLGDRILIKNQAATLQNGIYTVTTLGSGASNWVLTRATDYNTPAAINVGDWTLVTNGTANAGSSWVQTATVTAIGTDPITFSVFFSPASYLPVANPIFTGTITGPSITFNSTSGVIGTTTNNNAAAGSVGELISSQVLLASATSISDGAATSLTSIALTAGDWDVWGNVVVSCTNAALTAVFVGISNTNNTFPDNSLTAGMSSSAMLANSLRLVAPMQRVSLSAPATYYITSFANFAAGTSTQCGGIYARRRR